MGLRNGMHEYMNIDEQKWDYTTPSDREIKRNQEGENIVLYC